eukprot:gene33227-42522_t
MDDCVIRARGVPDWSKAKAVHSCVGCVMKVRRPWVQSAELRRMRREGALPGFHAVYLDHCGSLVGREQQLRDVFRNHVIANGGVLAVTFST